MKWGLKLTVMEWTMWSFQSRHPSPARTDQISLQTLDKLCSLYSWRLFLQRSALWVAESKMFSWWPAKEIPATWNIISSQPMSNRHWSLFTIGPLQSSMCQGPILLARGEEFHLLNPRACLHDWSSCYDSCAWSSSAACSLFSYFLSRQFLISSAVSYKWRYRQLKCRWLMQDIIFHFFVFMGELIQCQWVLSTGYRCHVWLRLYWKV